MGYRRRSTTEAALTMTCMTPSQRAFLDAQIALSAWRAARSASAGKLALAHQAGPQAGTTRTLHGITPMGRQVVVPSGRRLKKVDGG
jgi:hypothetical protein